LRSPCMSRPSPCICIGLRRPRKPSIVLCASLDVSGCAPAMILAAWTRFVVRCMHAVVETWPLVPASSLTLGAGICTVYHLGCIHSQAVARAVLNNLVCLTWIRAQVRGLVDPARQVHQRHVARVAHGGAPGLAGAGRRAAHVGCSRSSLLSAGASLLPLAAFSCVACTHIVLALR
jgi:hypothetical protein